MVTTTTIVNNRPKAFRAREWVRKRTGHQHRKRKSRTIPANYFQVHTAYAVYCEFGDVSLDFVRPYQSDHSLKPNRKRVREFAPLCKVPDTGAAEQCFEPNSRVNTSILPSANIAKTLALRSREWGRKRTGHQHRKRKSRTYVLLFCAGDRYGNRTHVFSVRG